MDFIASVRDTYEATFHYYVMTAALLLVLSCLIKDSVCKLFKANLVKLVIFVLMMITGFAWAGNVTQMRNMHDFSSLEDESQLWKMKHEYSKLQRDVYIQGFAAYCLFILLTFPRYYQDYIETAKAFQRKIDELTRNKSN